MFEPTDIHEGMVVRSPDGQILGRVFAVGNDSFEIEKGLFFPKEYRVDVIDVDDIRDGEIVLSYGRDGLHAADDLTTNASAGYEEDGFYEQGRGSTDGSSSEEKPPDSGAGRPHTLH